MERYNCVTFFKGFPKQLRPREFEERVVRRFNEILEMFPPGVGPSDVIGDASTGGLIKEARCRDGRRVIIYTRAKRKPMRVRQ